MNPSSLPYEMDQCLAWLAEPLKELHIRYEKQLIHSDKLPVQNPANGQNIIDIPYITDLNAVDHALSNATKHALIIQPKWAKPHALRDRSRLLRCWYDLIIEHRYMLASIISLEQGKLFLESLAEIDYAARYIEWYSEEAKRVHGSWRASDFPGGAIHVIPRAVGLVYAAIPWNFPASMATRKVAAALAAGCAIILKPSELTPLTAIALHFLASKTELNMDLFPLLCGDANAISQAVMQMPSIRKISFTGSTKIGMKLYQQAAPTLKKLSLELGGNAPFIIGPNAALPLVYKELKTAKWRNSGQSCIAANRVYVHKNHINTVIDHFTAFINQLHLGSAHNPKTTLAPLTPPYAKTRIETLMQQAEQAGARCLAKSNMPSSAAERNGFFVPASLWVDIPLNHPLYEEEIFGPLLALYPFEELDELISLANSSLYGLAAYVFDQDEWFLENIISTLRPSMIGVNNVSLTNERAPFGGTYYSGFGKEGGKEGIEEYLEYSYIHRIVNQ
jgi:succinate-semialdehyde dehydrogenase/glutarate-semialdehyde dehydrogenase